ncbi:MAG: rhomboid family intramembrane serine protease [Phycisphaerales bacterium]|nr:rhomboid family intramembrane serine protease [Phycisphaerales bacterium]
MGIADRDYTRASNDLRGRSRRVGRLGIVSVNTWLIVINVAVFLVANVLLGNVLFKTGAGSFTIKGVTQQQQDNAKVDRSISLPFRDAPGMLYHPKRDPQTPATDSSGRLMLGLDGKPQPAEVGGERFWYRPVIESFGHFSCGKAFLELQVWRFITFQFLHADVYHLLFNMLGLWFVGGLVEEYLGRRRYLAFYLACGVFGAIAYLALNLFGFIVFQYISPGLKGLIPALLFDDIFTPLIGASAGVFGVLMAAAKIAPDSIVDVLLIIPMKLRTAVYIFLGLAALNLLRSGPNAGGDAAHVGGAIAGAILIRRTHLLRDFFDVFSDSRKTVRPGRAVPVSTAGGPPASEVDAVLDKIRASGLGSLTEHERKILERESAAARREYLD